MVVPRLADDLKGNRDSHRTCCDCHIKSFAAVVVDGAALIVGLGILEQIVDQRRQTGHTHADPDGEGIERTGESVVALTRLQRRLIQIEHDGYTCHEKEEENHPELLDAALGAESLPCEADDAHEQREHEEHVVSLVVLAVIGGK